MTQRSTARIPPREAPFPPPVAARLEAIMPPGVPPLTLFTTLARDARLFERFMAGGLLDRGNLSLREREIVIGRVTAQCGSEYEWCVHVAFFGPKAGLGGEEIRSLVHGDADDACWDEKERLLIRLCDALHADCDVDDQLWTAVAERYAPEAVLECLMLAGQYRMVSYLTNALRLPLEPFAVRFPET